MAPGPAVRLAGGVPSTPRGEPRPRHAGGSGGPGAAPECGLRSGSGPEPCSETTAPRRATSRQAGRQRPPRRPASRRGCCRSPGSRSGVTAARRAEELGALLVRRGAAVLHAPALRTVPLPDDGELLAATRRLIAHAPMWCRHHRHRLPRLGRGRRGLGSGRGAAGRGCGTCELLARGPKVRGAIRAAGLPGEWSPASESMAEVLDRLLERGVDGPPDRCSAARRPAARLHRVAAGRGRGGGRRAGVPLDAARGHRPARPAAGRDRGRRPGRDHLHQRAGRRQPAGAGRAARHARRVSSPRCATMCWPPASARSPRLPLVALDVPTHQPARFRLGPLVQLLTTELPERARTSPSPGGGWGFVAGRLGLRARAAVVDGEVRAVLATPVRGPAAKGGSDTSGRPAGPRGVRSRAGAGPWRCGFPHTEASGTSHTRGVTGTWRRRRPPTICGSTPGGSVWTWWPRSANGSASHRWSGWTGWNGCELGWSAPNSYPGGTGLEVVDARWLTRFHAARDLLHRIVHTEVAGHAADSDLERVNALAATAPPAIRAVRDRRRHAREPARRAHARPAARCSRPWPGTRSSCSPIRWRARQLRQCEGDTCSHGLSRHLPRQAPPLVFQRGVRQPRAGGPAPPEGGPGHAVPDASPPTG